MYLHYGYAIFQALSFTVVLREYPVLLVKQGRFLYNRAKKGGMTVGDNVHAGHRNRMRDRFRASSLKAMEEHEQLELLLFYAIPRTNTNETAHRLLNTFGSIPAIIDAPLEEIERVPGVGPGAGIFFRFLREFYPIYAKKHSQPKRIIRKPIDAARMLMDMYTYTEAEAVTMILLNSHKKVLFSGIVYVDGPNSVQVDLRRIAQMALSYDATAMILGHNHPSGISTASTIDLRANEQVEKSLAYLGITLLDHIIVTEDNYYSLAEHGHIHGQNSVWPREGTANISAEYKYL